MEHDAIKENLFALYDEELGSAMRQEIEAHMALCQECRELYQSWAKTAKVLFKAPRVASSEFFVTGVMNRIHALESPKPQRRWGMPMRWLVPAMGFALALLAVIRMTPQTLSIEAFLLQSSGSHSWIYSNDTLGLDETLQYVMEG